MRGLEAGTMPLLYEDQDASIEFVFGNWTF